MDYRSVALREIGWGKAVIALASIGLAACDSGGGSGGCPQLGGSWTVSGSCVDAAGISCQVDQEEDSCAVTFSCSDGRTLMGTVSKSSVSFRDEDVSCRGSLDNLEDDDGNGLINPEIDGSCTPTGGEMCDIDADCQSGNCTIPEDDDDGNDEGDSGAGGSAGVLSGSGGASGIGGQGGSSGVFGGTSGTSGIGGQGGSSGVFGGSSGIGGESGTAPAGTGGVGGTGAGAIDPAACASCVDTFCQSALSTCTEENGCLIALDCTIGSGCSQDDGDCILEYCSGVTTFTPDGETAVEAVSICMGQSCLGDCTASGPVAGSGGVGGVSGEGGVGGVPPGPGCDDSCGLVDAECDDGGPGAITNICPLGTDCTDCGPR
jgi:hypothetical protein